MWRTGVLHWRSETDADPRRAWQLSPAAIQLEMQRGHGVHYPKPGALTLTQSTELGTIYQPDEIRVLAATPHAHGLAVHMDGAQWPRWVARAEIGRTFRTLPLR